MTRTKQHQNSIRSEMIREIRSINYPRGKDPRLASETNVNLLRDCHPLYRKQYVRKLLKTGGITKGEASLFGIHA